MRLDGDRLVAAQEVHQNIGVLFEGAPLILDGDAQHCGIAWQSPRAAT